MYKRFVLTSMIAVGVVGATYAAPSNTSGEFPSDGKMQEDTTYVGQAVYANTGIYEGNVVANALYDWVTINLPAGQYLPADTEVDTPAVCTAGNFCLGAENIHYDEDNDQGLTSCSTLDNGAYPNSDAGARANTDCYRACSGNVTIAHATGVTGNEYYGGVNNCSVTGCENGYHKVYSGGGEVDYRGSLATELDGGAATSGPLVSQVNEQGIWVVKARYGFTGNLSEAGRFITDFGDAGFVVGQGICSTRQGTSNEVVSDVANETGETGAVNCYCRLTGYTPQGGSEQSVNGLWVYRDSWQDNGTCTHICAGSCGQSTGENQSFRSALIGDTGIMLSGTALATCAANQITITWNDVDPEIAGNNNEGTTVYDGDIRTPVRAIIKKGKEFRGWVFEKENTPTSTPGPEVAP